MKRREKGNHSLKKGEKGREEEKESGRVSAKESVLRAKERHENASAAIRL